MTGNRQGNPYSTFDGEDGSVLQGDNELIDNTRDHRTDRQTVMNRKTVSELNVLRRQKSSR